jgi:nucleotide-binding universal stress UspA family protein
VHAFTDVSTSGGHPHRVREGWGTLVAHAEAALDEVVDAAERRHPRVRFRRLVVAGTALTVLIQEAATARMVVVGQRDERVPTGPMVLGSTSRGLVEFAPCPVVVARSVVADADAGADQATARADG